VSTASDLTVDGIPDVIVSNPGPSTISYLAGLCQMPVSTLASLVGAEAEPDRVRITWDLSANPGVSAAIYRRTEGAPWARIIDAVADGTGRIVYEDADVVPGRRYGYRLGIMDAGTEVFLAEAWVETPSFAPGIDSVHPNPATGAFEVRFSLGAGAPARLELLDVSGRRVIAAT